MSKYFARHEYTSESVSEGHPDKVADQISDGILDACLAKDPDAHVACETACGRDLVVNLGEITCKDFDTINTEAIAREIVELIGYTDPDEGFASQSFRYLSNLHGQSPDINQGVSRAVEMEQGAGDQGMMFGYATMATPELMPAPILYSHRILERLSALRRVGTIDYLRPDAKAQLTMLFDQGRAQAITKVVVSQQTRDVPLAKIVKDVTEVVHEVLDPTGLLTANTGFLINPTGKFVIGGPCGDAGVTGRKIIVDTYGGMASHGGGAFSGKDPSKVDRSAAYYARYAAKNIVAAGLAEKCEIQVAYAIGVARPMSLNVATYGTNKIPEEKILALLQDTRFFDFRPAALIKKLGLKTPHGWSYRQACVYGHFGRPNVPWEQLDLVPALRDAVGLKDDNANGQ